MKSVFKGLILRRFEDSSARAYFSSNTFKNGNIAEKFRQDEGN
jgi:hypothetical protein